VSCIFLPSGADPGGGAMFFLPPPENVLCQKKVEERGNNTKKWRGKWKENREGE